MTNRLLGWFVNPQAHVNDGPQHVQLITSDPVPDPSEDLAYIPVPGRTDQDNHEHALAAVAVQQGQRMPMQPWTTVVLFGCKICSYVHDQTLSGTWSLEQVTALHRQQGGSDAA